MGGTRLDGLEIDENLGFQRRSWAVQRLGWALMALFVLAAAAGLFGAGPFSHARAELPGFMTIDYQRFARFETTETLTVRLAPAATTGHTVRVSLNQELREAVLMSTVVPTPDRVEAAAGRLVYVFNVGESGVPMVVTFSYEPKTIGRYRAVVGLESPTESRSVTFHQTIYP